MEFYANCFWRKTGPAGYRPASLSHRPPRCGGEFDATRAGSDRMASSVNARYSGARVLDPETKPTMPLSANRQERAGVRMGGPGMGTRNRHQLRKSFTKSVATCLHGEANFRSV